MLKTECAKCREWVHLPFTSVVTETVCPSCNEMIPVKEVYVSAGPFMILRDVLSKNMFKYKRLVLEAEMEVRELGKYGNSRGYDISAQSIGMFVSNIKEMLDGCRDNLRHRLEEDHMEYIVDGRAHKGNIVNISVSGICMDAGKNAGINKLGGEIVLRLKANESSGEFNLSGSVVRIGAENHIGVKFTNMDEDSRKKIEDFILVKSLMILNK
ncbi:MAG: PilZ domain-containing protein [Deltaproteobacteria bacterium]|nr:PilZ domain-containing protein [Deltaproteobacteria bacterium]